MISGCGIYIFENKRMERSRTKFGTKIFEKFFTEREISYSGNKISWAQHLGARFAAKCALFQAMKWLKVRDYTLIEIRKDNLGAPYFEVTGEINEYIGKMRISRINLTITHVNEYSIANVIME